MVTTPRTITKLVDILIEVLLDEPPPPGAGGAGPDAEGPLNTCVYTITIRLQILPIYLTPVSVCIPYVGHAYAIFILT